MQAVLAISLMIVGFVVLGVANFIYFGAEADLLDKRPDLSGEIYGWFGRSKFYTVMRFYKAEFPQGRRIRNMWVCAVAGWISALSGFLMLGHM
jgi:hypothetical protein